MCVCVHACGCVLICVCMHSCADVFTEIIVGLGLCLHEGGCASQMCQAGENSLAHTFIHQQQNMLDSDSARF